MAVQFFLTTTGTPSTVVIADLGNITFAHPVVSAPLIAPEGQFSMVEIRDSVDLQAAITGGEVTIVDQQGNSITNLSEQAEIGSYFKVSIDDSTPGTLVNKIDATGNIIGSIVNASGDEQISLSVNPANPIDAADVAYNDAGVPVGSPLDGQTDVQSALNALNLQVDTNADDIADIVNSYDQPNGIPLLDGAGLIKGSQLPDLAITNTVVVADITARDALGWGADQEGDVAIVTDAGDDPNVPAGEAASYIWDGSAFIRLVDGGKVYSVNGEDGIVQLDAVDIPYDETGAPVGSPTDGTTEVQGAIDALNVAVDGLQDDSHVPAISGNDAINVDGPTQAVSLVLDTVTNGGDNAAVITPGQGLYVSPDNFANLFFGLSGNQNQSIYLKTFSGQFSNNNPVRIGQDIEIFRVDAFNEIAETDGWNAEVYINGAISGTLTTTVTGGSSFATNSPGSPVSVTAGQRISVRFVNTSGQINSPSVLLHYNYV